MSYRIDSISLTEFIDSNYKLPRFQRKPTWDKKQSFELCVSIFQQYPIGVTIINTDQSDTWLLDGRQRRTALTSMRNNPGEVYVWAKNYIGFNPNSDEGEITNKYWEKVEQYLQTENGEQNANSEDEDDNSYEGEEDVKIEDSINLEQQRKGLKILLDIILIVHKGNPSSNRLTKTFDFTKYFGTRLTYAPKKENNKVNVERLRKFLLDFSGSVPKISEFSEDDLIEYYYDTFSEIDDDSKKKKFENEIKNNWEYIKKAITVVFESEKVFKEARIGVITLTNVSPLDAQNIFSRINTGGTQLKAEELLSAKPYWNQVVSITDSNTISLVKDMYEKISLPEPETYVKWDLAATLIARIDKNNLVFPKHETFAENPSVNLSEVTLGFKLISSCFVGGMSANDVIAIEAKDVISNVDVIDDFVYELNCILNALMNDNFFKTLNAWNKPIDKLLGDAIALEFITILYKNWDDKQKPTGGTKYDAFIRDAKILLDRLIFEYSTKVWRGSGDSKMASDISDWKNRIQPIDENDWIAFVKSVMDGSYNGQEITAHKTLTPILYYYYSLRGDLPLAEIDVTFDVDHIIPQSKFDNNTLASSYNKNSLSNLALLPKKTNIKKGGKTLSEITDPWLIKAIKNYENISADDFDDLSTITNFGKLKKLREPDFINVFSVVRKSELSK